MSAARKKIEQAVLALLIAELTKRGWRIDGLNDGGQFIVRRTERTLTKEVFDLDDCHIYFSKHREDTGRVRHWVKFVRGNDGIDAISDWTIDDDNAPDSGFNWILAHVLGLIDKSEVRFVVQS